VNKKVIDPYIDNQEHSKTFKLQNAINLPIEIDLPKEDGKFVSVPLAYSGKSSKKNSDSTVLKLDSGPATARDKEMNLSQDVYVNPRINNFTFISIVDNK